MQSLNTYYQRVKAHCYYWAIFLLSLFVVVVGPMIGSSIEDVRAQLPDTALGWFIYVVSSVAIGLIGMAILYCFVRQAEENVKDNANYLRARALCRRGSAAKKHRLISYEDYMGRIFKRKSATIFLSSLLGVFTIGQAILTYDYNALIAYIVVILLQLIFGFLTMQNTETYLTYGYLEYAIYTYGTKEEIEEYDRI